MFDRCSIDVRQIVVTYSVDARLMCDGCSVDVTLIDVRQFCVTYSVDDRLSFDRFSMFSLVGRHSIDS